MQPDLLFDPAFIAEEERADLFASLSREIAFAPESIRIFGRLMPVPRLVAWHGDPDTAYVYSGTHHDPLPWTPALAHLRARVSARAGQPFNSVLANLYRSGTDSMGWHSDDEPELGPDPVIASLSLGATRRFRLKPKAAGGRPVEIALTDGSLLVMRAGVQRGWQHAIPKEAAVQGPRINLTFRTVTPAARPSRSV